MMKTWFSGYSLYRARQVLCLFICALFVLPAFAVQPLLAAADVPLSEEREESEDSKSADDDGTTKDSINQVNRRAVAQRSPIGQSIAADSNRSHRPAPFSSASELKDVYQNGLGTRLRC
jgi:hypothetical protein